jgi:hypothetical protein
MLPESFYIITCNKKRCASSLMPTNGCMLRKQPYADKNFRNN